jgi:hypothetical protein
MKVGSCVEQAFPHYPTHIGDVERLSLDCRRVTGCRIARLPNHVEKFVAHRLDELPFFLSMGNFYAKQRQIPGSAVDDFLDGGRWIIPKLEQFRAAILAFVNCSHETQVTHIRDLNHSFLFEGQQSITETATRSSPRALAADRRLLSSVYGRG